MHYLLHITYYLYLVEQTGIEPVPLVFQTNVQTCYTTLPNFIGNE
jgi:hypothetical protein